MKFGIAALALFAMLAPARAGSDAPDGRATTILLLGDTGLNMTHAPVAPEGGFKFDRQIGADEAMRDVRALLSADLVLANLETAVTDRNDLPPREKRFVFRTHPAAIRAFVMAGVNAFSLANNHTLDYGLEGGGETLRHVSALGADGLRAWPGLGRTLDEALAPHATTLGDTRFAISAIGIGGKGFSLPAGETGAGMAVLESHYDEAVRRLHAAPADVRILSVHYGLELASYPDAFEIAQFQKQADAPDGVSIVSGHHAHVAKGVTIKDGHLVAYGLGNFLHFGMLNMAGLGICRDFGLALRVTLSRDGDAHAIDAVEAFALEEMQIRPAVLKGAAAALRLDVLNHLGAALDHAPSGVRGLRFAPQSDGRGLWCRAGARLPDCAGWMEPPLADGERRLEIERACGRTLYIAGAGEDTRGWPRTVGVSDLLRAEEAARREIPAALGVQVDMRAIDAAARHADEERRREAFDEP